MSATSNYSVSQSHVIYKVAAAFAFMLSIAVGGFFPIFAIPWMFFVAYLGLDYRKELKGSFLWEVEQGLMLAAIVLGAAIFVVLGFVLPWTSKPLR